jgi:deoxyribodipyrimidine photo-lyase
MQAGVTGINTIRIYNPVKQSLDHDPDAVFIRKWLPELAKISQPMIHQPWLMTAIEQKVSGIEPGNHFPKPVIELEIAAKHAREQLWKVKGSTRVKQYNKIILAHLSGRANEEDNGA